MPYTAETNDLRMLLLDCPIRGRKFESFNQLTPAIDWEILRGLLETHQPRTVVEVGCWTGATTLLLCEFAEVVFAVDHWSGEHTDGTGGRAQQVGPERVFQTFCSNLSDVLFRQVFPCRGESTSWGAAWPRERQVDMVYIDASHDRPAVMRDIEAWLPHVKQGGLIAGHDFGPQFPGVQEAVEAMLPAYEHDNRIWWCEKI